jgi:hypothetical protein
LLANLIPSPVSDSTLDNPKAIGARSPLLSLHSLICGAAILLVAVPVFLQAPLVRSAPALSLILTVGLLALSRLLMSKSQSQVWGSLIWGFSITWLCGTIYWGWLRAEPIFHLPIESLGLPWAIWAIRRSPNHWIGAWFYLGSLLGTTVTDIYFWLVGVVPHWRSLMQLETDEAATRSILQSAAALVQTEWGILLMTGLGIGLLLIAMRAWRSPKLHFWGFGGAVFSTLLVDGLFGLAAFWA